MALTTETDNTCLPEMASLIFKCAQGPISALQKSKLAPRTDFLFLASLK